MRRRLSTTRDSPASQRNRSGPPLPSSSFDSALLRPSSISRTRFLTTSRDMVVGRARYRERILHWEPLLTGGICPRTGNQIGRHEIRPIEGLSTTIAFTFTEVPGN